MMMLLLCNEIGREAHEALHSLMMLLLCNEMGGVVERHEGLHSLSAAFRAVSLKINSQIRL